MKMVGIAVSILGPGLFFRRKLSATCVFTEEMGLSVGGWTLKSGGSNLREMAGAVGHEAFGKWRILPGKSRDGKGTWPGLVLPSPIQNAAFNGTSPKFQTTGLGPKTGKKQVTRTDLFTNPFPNHLYRNLDLSYETSLVVSALNYQWSIRTSRK